jgi:hypothetical protein
MFASVLIIGFSLVLFAYWFRYSCILLLRSQVEQAASAPAAADNRFSFMEVRERLKTEPVLDPLHRSLNHDYQVLIYLLEHAAGLELASIEDRLLMLDYRVMQGWYRLTKIAAPAQARKALSEMASILGVLSWKMGEQASARIES